MSSVQRMVLAGVLVAVGCATAEDPNSEYHGDPSGGGGGSAGSSGSTGIAGSSTSGGFAGVVSAGGSAGVVGTGGVSGTTATGGAAGSSGGAGSGGLSGSGGTGGTASGGSAGQGGSSGSTSSGGSSGSAGAGTSGSGGSGGSGTGCSPFSDDFEDGNASGWDPSGGTWGVVSDGTMVYQGGLGSQESIVGSSCGNQSVEARVKVVAFGDMSGSHRVGIIGRYAGSSSFYTFQIDGNGDLRLLRSTSTAGSGSGCETIADSLAVDQWYTLRMDITGPAGSVNIKTYLDGVPKHDCTISGSNAFGAGQFGLVTYGSGTNGRFDDFTVSVP